MSERMERNSCHKENGYGRYGQVFKCNEAESGG